MESSIFPRLRGGLQALAETPPLVSVMAANNETGVIQPIPEIAAMVHDAGGLLHVDAVQVAGRIRSDINEMGADLLSISAHKLGGPMGVGALVRRAGAPAIIEPHIKGGGQERGARAGTENVAGIAGFGAAAAAAACNHGGRRPSYAGAAGSPGSRPRAQAQRSSSAKAPSGSPIPPCSQHRGSRRRSHSSSSTSRAFAVSSGSACSSGKVAASHVLAAMGVAPELASGAIRVSVGPTTTENEIDSLIEAWRMVVAGLSRDKGGLAA